VKVSPPGTGAFSQLASLLGAAVLGIAALFIVVPPALDLVADFRLVQAAQSVPWAHLERGECSTRVILTSCEVEMRAQPPQGAEVRRKVDYLFVDFHTGAYQVAVLADPAQPARLTTDLGQEKLWNRIFTLALAGPVFLFIAVALLFAPLLMAPGRFRENRRLARVMSEGPLRATALRLVKLEPHAWTVAPTVPGAGASERSWPMKGYPLFIDPAQSLVLGVTTGDGSVAVPLDAKLSFIQLSSEERRRLLDWIGPERLAWRPPGSVASPGRARLRKAATPMLMVGLVIGAAAASLAWFAQREPDAGAYVNVDLEDRNAPRAGKVRLDGMLQNQLHVQSIWTDAQAAHLEQYRPMTRVGWQAGEPVEWLIKEVSSAKTEPERTARLGTVSAAPLPADARTGFAKRGVKLAAGVTTVETAPPPDDQQGMWEGVLLLSALAGALLLVSLIGYAAGWRLRPG
jgi:hypothetical protein